MATEKTVVTAAKNVSETVAAVKQSLVDNGKINYKRLAEMGNEVSKSLTEVHSAIEGMWKAEKCRELATLESIVRNTVEYMDRLPTAAQAFSSKNPAGGSTSKRASILTKPR